MIRGDPKPIRQLQDLNWGAFTMHLMHPNLGMRLLCSSYSILHFSDLVPIILTCKTNYSQFMLQLLLLEYSLLSISWRSNMRPTVL